MMEKYRMRRPGHRKRGSSGAPEDVVTMCKEYSSRLQQSPIDVKLHTHVGATAAGTVGLERNAEGVAEMVIQAQGSQLFGLVRKKHRHTFTPGELERTGTHTAFLRRSVKAIKKGDEAGIAEMLARSLSLIRNKEAVDITFKTKAARDEIGDFIDAKWSVSKLQQSFRRDARTTLALQGKNKTLHNQGFYEILDKVKIEESQQQGALLPKLDSEKLHKLQDDLLDGIHVTYHDKAWKGVNIRSRPCRLRHDCESEEGLIILEPSFTDGGPTISRPLADLVQVGGGPSAFGLTALALRVTSDTPEARAKAVSLVFSDVSMDITCASEEDATEIVLFFSAARGFSRAAAPPPPDSPLPARSLLKLGVAPETTSGAWGALSPRSATKHRAETHAKAMEVLFQSETGEPVDRVEIQSAVAVAQAMALHPMGVNHRSAPVITVNGGSRAPPGVQAHSVPSVAGGSDGNASAVESDWSKRFKDGLPGDGDKDALKKQLSAASGFGALSQLSLSSSEFGESERDAPRSLTNLPAVRETPALESHASGSSSFHQGLVDPSPFSAQFTKDDLGDTVTKSRVFHSAHVPIPTTSAAATTTMKAGFSKSNNVANTSNFSTSGGVPSRQSPRDASEAWPSPRRRTVEDIPRPNALSSPPERRRANTQVGSGTYRKSTRSRPPPERRGTLGDTPVSLDHRHLFHTAPTKGDVGAVDTNSSSSRQQTRRRGLMLRQDCLGDDPSDTRGVSGEGADGSGGSRPTPLRHLNLKKAIPGREGGLFSRDRPLQEQAGVVWDSGREPPREDRHHLRKAILGGGVGTSGPGHHFHLRHHHDKPHEVTGPVREDRKENRQSITSDPRAPSTTHTLFTPANAEPFTSPAAVAMSRADAEAASRAQEQLSPLTRSGNGRLQSSNVASRWGKDSDEIVASRPGLQSVSPVDRRPDGVRSRNRDRIPAQRDTRLDSRDARNASGGGAVRAAASSAYGSYGIGGGAQDSEQLWRVGRASPRNTSAAGVLPPPLPARSPTGSSGSGSGGDLDRSAMASKRRAPRTLGHLIGTLTSRSGSNAKRRDRESRGRSLSPSKAGPESTDYGLQIGAEQRSTTPSRLRRMGKGVQGMFSSHQGSHGVDDFGAAGFKSMPGRARTSG